MLFLNYVTAIRRGSASRTRDRWLHKDSVPNFSSLVGIGVDDQIQ